MSKRMIYHSFLTQLIKGRRDVLSGTLTTEEANSAYDIMHEQLNVTHDLVAVWEAYDQFESDLKLMDWFEWLESAGPGGYTVALMVMFFVEDEKVNRMSRLWDKLVQLDEEFEDDGPNDVGT